MKLWCRLSEATCSVAYKQIHTSMPSRTSISLKHHLHNTSYLSKRYPCARRYACIRSWKSDAGCHSPALWVVDSYKEINMFNFTPLLGTQSSLEASQSLLELEGGIKVLIDVGWDDDFDAQKLERLKR